MLEVLKIPTCILKAYQGLAKVFDTELVKKHNGRILFCKPHAFTATDERLLLQHASC